MARPLFDSRQTGKTFDALKIPDMRRVMIDRSKGDCFFIRDETSDGRPVTDLDA